MCVWWGEHEGGSLAGDSGKVRSGKSGCGPAGLQKPRSPEPLQATDPWSCRSGAWPSMLGEEACIITLNSREVTV